MHDGCTGATFKGLGKQAPLGTVELYNRTVLDTYKVAGAMYTELDRGIQTVIDALQEKRMWESTVLIFVSDNGGPLDHCTNSPLRGGKCVPQRPLTLERFASRRAWVSLLVASPHLFFYGQCSRRPRLCGTGIPSSRVACV